MAAAAAAAGCGGTDSGSDTDSIIGLRRKRDASTPTPSWFIVCQLFNNFLISIRFDMGWLFHIPERGLPIPGFIGAIRLFLSVDPPGQQKWDAVNERDEQARDTGLVGGGVTLDDSTRSVLLFNDFKTTTAGVRECVNVLNQSHMRRAMCIMFPCTSWSQTVRLPCPSPQATVRAALADAGVICKLLESEHALPAPVAELTASYISIILPFVKQTERLRAIDKPGCELSLEVSVANSRSWAETHTLMNVEIEREALRMYADVVKEWLSALQTAVNEQCSAKPATAAALASAASLDTDDAAEPAAKKRKTL